MTQSPLPEITSWLETATRGLPPHTRALAAQELTAHYTDAVAAHRAANIPEYEARNLALAELGDPNATALGLRSVHLPLRRLWAGLAASLLFPMVFGLIAIGYPLIGETLAYLILDLSLIGTALVVMPVFQRLPQLSPIALERPVMALNLTLVLGVGSRVLYHLIYRHPLFYPAQYYFLPVTPWPETVLFLGFLSCQIPGWSRHAVARLEASCGFRSTLWPAPAVNRTHGSNGHIRGGVGGFDGSEFYDRGRLVQRHRQCLPDLYHGLPGAALFPNSIPSGKFPYARQHRLA